MHLSSVVLPTPLRPDDAAQLAVLDRERQRVQRAKAVGRHADHQHVEMLVDRIDGVGARGIGRRWQDIALGTGADDVRRVTAASTFRVIGMDRAARYRRERRLDEAGLVEGVGVDRHLHVVRIGSAQGGVDRGGRRAPVLVQLEPDRAGLDLLDERWQQACVPLAEKAEIHGERVGRFEHALQVPRPRRARRRERSRRRTRAAAEHRGDARRERIVDLLRADEMDVRVDAAGGDDHPLARDAPGRMHDDGLADLPPFRVEHPLHHERTHVLAMHEARRAALPCETQRERGTPVRVR